MALVYWIHLAEHTDIFSQGYIGVTTQSVEQRFYQHVNTSDLGSNITISKAIRKHRESLILTTLVVGEEDYCYELERKLRPEKRTGWNTVEGGGKPPVFNKPHTMEARLKIGAAAKARAQSPTMLAVYAANKGKLRGNITKAKMREAAKDRLPWETSRCNKEVWSLAATVYSFWSENPSFGYIKLEQSFSFPKYSLQVMYKKFKKQNWNPNLDQDWLSWVQNYKLIKEI